MQQQQQNSGKRTQGSTGCFQTKRGSFLIDMYSVDREWDISGSTLLLADENVLIVYRGARI